MTCSGIWPCPLTHDLPTLPTSFIRCRLQGISVSEAKMPERDASSTFNRKVPFLIPYCRDTPRDKMSRHNDIAVIFCDCKTLWSFSNCKRSNHRLKTEISSPKLVAMLTLSFQRPSSQPYSEIHGPHKSDVTNLTSRDLTWT